MKKSPITQQVQPAVHSTMAGSRAKGLAEPGKNLHTGVILSEGLLKKVFFFSLLAMLLITLVSGYNCGFNSDEVEMNNYGKANYAYYTSGGKDTAITGVYYKFLKYYGNAFEMIAVGVNKLTGNIDGPNEFNTRHIVNQVIALVGLLFAGLLARKFSKNWQVPIFTAWMLFLTPSFMGHFAFNTRDIPFCTGYIATIYFIVGFLEELPEPSWKAALKVMVAFAFTTNIRIGGFLLLVYLFLFLALYLATNSKLLQATLKNIGGLAAKLGTILVGGVALVIVTWPYMLMSPSSLIEALGVAKKFPLKVAINFEGGTISSLAVPSHYLPEYMLITIPIVITICIVGGAVLYFARRGKYDVKLGLLGLFAILFPVIYAVSTDAALYSSWRHFLFIFPLMCIFGGIFLNEMLILVKKPVLKIAIICVFLAALARPVAFCVQNNPYEYCYFNELAGSFKSAYYNYDNDYWSISVKNALEWLMKNEPIAGSKDTITIGTNTIEFMEYYLSKHYPKAKIKLVDAGVTSRSIFDWRYCVFSNLFVKPDYLESYYPLPRAIYSENIDGLAIASVIRDTIRLDQRAQTAFENHNYSLADSLYTAHFAITKDHDPTLGGYVSVIKASLGQNEVAIAEAKKCLEYHFSNGLDYYAQLGLGLAYGNMKQYNLSVAALQAADGLFPGQSLTMSIMDGVKASIERDRAAGLLK